MVLFAVFFFEKAKILRMISGYKDLSISNISSNPNSKILK